MLHRIISFKNTLKKQRAAFGVNAILSAPLPARRALATKYHSVLAKKYGGKGAWLKILQALQPLFAEQGLAYRLPETVYIDVQTLWKPYFNQYIGTRTEGPADKIWAVRDLEKEAQHNAIQAIILREPYFKDVACGPKLIKNELDQKLIDIIAEKIKEITPGQQIIVRSSGFWEDSFSSALAGKFWSLGTNGEQKEISEAIDVIFIHTLYCGKSILEKFRGDNKLSQVLNERKGMAILLQPFLEFDAWGVALSKLYQHISIEAYFGDPKHNPAYEGSNSAIYLIKEGSLSEVDIYTSYDEYPDLISKKGQVYKEKQENQQVLQDYPRCGEIPVPLSKEQSLKLAKLCALLEEMLGTAVDVEWGIKDGELYLVQVRPLLGDFNRPLSSFINKTAQPLLVRSPIALGQTTAEGIQGVVVKGLNYKMRSHYFLLNSKDKFPDDIMIRRWSKVPVSAVLMRLYVLVRKLLSVPERLDERIWRILHAKVPTEKLKQSYPVLNFNVEINPDIGSRQFHEVISVSEDVAEGKLFYIAGDLLKKGLCKKIPAKNYKTILTVVPNHKLAKYAAQAWSGLAYYPHLRLLFAEKIMTDRELQKILSFYTNDRERACMSLAIKERKTGEYSVLTEELTYFSNGLFGEFYSKAPS